MLQVNEIQKHFNQIEQSIEKASHACKAGSAVPAEVQNCLTQLDQQSTLTKEMLESTEDENSIRQAVDDLEEVGDNAKQACLKAPNLNADVKNAINQVHTELSDLKRQLH